jgi:hypothetical protein
MAIYDESSFGEIADAIGVEIGQIVKHENLFEAAARWHRLGIRPPERMAPVCAGEWVRSPRALTDCLSPGCK